MPQLHLTGDERADALLSGDAFALLVGMLLDQQFPMERAFAGPLKVLDRLGSIDPRVVAAVDPEEFEQMCATPPAIHRYARAMARRIQELARVVVDSYGGDASRIWREAADTHVLLARLEALPGFGQQKARIFAALLGKQLAVQHPGWREAIGPYAEEGATRSIADVTDATSLDAVRQFKKAAKAAARPA